MAEQIALTAWMIIFFMPIIIHYSDGLNWLKIIVSTLFATTLGVAFVSTLMWIWI